MKYATEDQLVEDLQTHLRRLKLPTRREIPSLGRCIDLVVFHQAQIMAIEAKLRDWKQAIVQVTDQSLSVEKMVVAVDERLASNSTFLNRCRRDGIGIVEIRPSGFTFHVPPEPNNPWSPQREALLSRCQQVERLDG